ncbi:ABC1-domain-containing protein [Hesseltinella vesiculosa]|uniref:ABC1-domain-containing protein n=1 Tax=Hesseltinella vesiculosa TaxID=101127 RepID=A0A1X2GWJ3_9FUNG|nr:ABC1-domain-containing protein [Hesseltinella vesiculosa]
MRLALSPQLHRIYTTTTTRQSTCRATHWSRSYGQPLHPVAHQQRSLATIPLASPLLMGPLPTICKRKQKLRTCRLAWPLIIPWLTASPVTTSFPVAAPFEQHDVDVIRHWLHRLWYECSHLVKEWLVEPLLTFRRFVHILLLLCPVALASPAMLFGSQVNKEETTGALWWYDFLANQMERAGPSFIKLAQWIASRTDLFPRGLCHRLSKLHSDVTAHSFDYTKVVLEETFGRRLDELFLELDPEPLGVGAIAQVYKARLHPDLILADEAMLADFCVDENVVTTDAVVVYDKHGKAVQIRTSVAIKVLHPKVKALVNRDLKIMACIAGLLTWIPSFHWLSLPQEVQVFGAMMRDQLDLRVEGQHLLRFNELFAGNPNVCFPRPYMYLTSEQVLVEEYEHGIPLSVFLKAAATAKRSGQSSGVFDKKIASIGLDTFLYMLIVYNFIHADLHPGNIMVRYYKPSAHHPVQMAWSKLMRQQLKDEGDQAVSRVRAATTDRALADTLQQLDDEGYVPQLVMIDTGLVNELNDKNRRNFLDLFMAIAQFDGYNAGRLMIERCQSPEHVINGELFALRMQRLILGLKENTFHLGTVRIGDLLSEVHDMVRTHHVKLEGDFINVVVGIMLLEGIGRQLDPDLDLFKNALPVLRKYSIQDGGKHTLQGMKDVQEQGVTTPHWIKVWIFLELRHWLTRTDREDEWLQMCDILCFNN